MEYVRLFFLFFALALAACVAVGLYKPWLVLWWEHVQNRQKVLAIYGTASLVSLLVYYLLRLL
jgi:uncharacterized membrane protein YjgN (DUF898 family)